MTEITFRRYTHASAPSELTSDLVECYRNVFADPPWNEWKVCSVCGHRFALKDKEILEANGFVHCNAPVVDFWTVEAVLEEIEREVTEKASCWLAFDGDQLVGFCWGYPASMEEIQSKVKIDFSERLRKMFGVRIRLGFQSELGLLGQYRGRKIAKELFRLRHEDFVSQNIQTGIVRTRELPEPSVTFQWFRNKLNYHIVVRYPGTDGRVILARDLLFLDRLLV